MSDPLVSIVVVTLNCGPKISGTLGSIVSQHSRQSIEVVVVDGASTDNTLDEVRKYSPETLLSAKDGGIYEAMNKGIGVAKGAYCMFINAGDELASTTVIDALRPELEAGAHDLLIGDHLVCYNDGLRILVKPRWPGSTAGMPFSHQAAVYRTSILRKFPFDSTYRLAADYDQLLRLLRSGVEPFRVDLLLSVVEAGGVSDLRRIKVIREWTRIGGFRLSYLRYLSQFVVQQLAARLLPARLHDAIRRRVRILKGA